MKNISDYFTSPRTTEIKNDLKDDNINISLEDANSFGSTSIGNMEEVTNICNSESKEKKVNKKRRQQPSSTPVTVVTKNVSNNLSISDNIVLSLEIEDMNQLNEKSIKNHKKSTKAHSAKNPDAKTEIPNRKLEAKHRKCLETSVNEHIDSKKSQIPLDDRDSSSEMCLNIQAEVCVNSLSQKTIVEEDNHNNKVNAFKVMMESRNKSIGHNSPGKEPLQDETSDENKNEDKQRLSARKSLLKNWAEKKGGSKRKREEEERDEIIKFKLKKRAKRFKKLLKVDEPIKVEEDPATTIVKKKNFKPVIESSSESSKESVIVVEPSVQPTTDLKYQALDIVEENAQDKVIKVETKHKEYKQNSLSFFGILNKSIDKIDNNDENPKLSTGVLNKKQKKTKSAIERFQSDEDSQLENVTKEKRKSTKKKISKKCLEPLTEDSSTLNNAFNLGAEGDSDNSLTPRSLKTWKMKIKLNTHENDETKMNDKRTLRTKRNISFGHLESITDESSNEGKIKTSLSKRKSKSKSVTVITCSDDDDKESKTRRSARIPAHPLPTSNEIILSDSEEDIKEKNASKKLVKVAPVFLKATPKPKPAPEVLEARKKFLMSGIPSSLKKTIEKQQSLEKRDFDVFPSISHIQQKCNSLFWTLAKPELSLKAGSPLKVEFPVECSGLTTSHILTNLDIQINNTKVDKLKSILDKIKADNPNYPVYKSFRQIYEKSGKTPHKKSEKHSKPKRNKKTADDSIEIIEPDMQNIPKYAMWTEKYKPQSSGDIIGNTASIKSVKKWLETWMKFSQEIIIKNKQQRRNSSSESEFDTTDCDSRDSTKLPGSTIILGGPCGSGKSTAVYAICKELGYNIIELNASSKRTGKRLLQELQEATQSHQVRKNEQNLQNFFQTKTNNEKKAATNDPQPEKKMCVLFIEDIDIVFDQDDGFISALTQLISTSKRPIIMTTTDTRSTFAQKFITQYDYISFLPLSSQMLATWLQIVCLVEGLFVNRDDIGCLLEFNAGDVRKTLLELQFWVGSGGQLSKDEIPMKTENKRRSTEEKLEGDEPPLSFIKDTNKVAKHSPFIHSNCIGSFEIFRSYKQYSVPYQLNLGLLWWNFPNILNVPNFSSLRFSRSLEDATNTVAKEGEKHEVTSVDKLKLLTVGRLHDYLALTDIMFRKVRYFDGAEPIVTNRSCEIRDSLELGESMDDYDGHLEFVHDITHTLVNGCIEEYNSIESEKSSLNMALPDRAERRWRAKQHVCEDVFQKALSFSSYVERKSVALDYMPSLRNISRSEYHRATNNTKRGNRFRNYLRDLNVNCNESTAKLTCNILTTND